MINRETIKFGSLVRRTPESVGKNNAYSAKKTVGEFMRFCTCGCKALYIWWPILEDENMESAEELELIND